jgi:hypothetical protein
MRSLDDRGSDAALAPDGVLGVPKSRSADSVESETAARAEVAWTDPGIYALEQALERLQRPNHNPFHQQTDVNARLQSPDFNPRALVLDDGQRRDLELLVRHHDKLVSDAYHFDAIESRLAVIEAIRRGEGTVTTETRFSTADQPKDILYFSNLPGPTNGTRRLVPLTTQNSPGLAAARRELERIKEARDVAIKAFDAGLSPR